MSNSSRSLCTSSNNTHSKTGNGSIRGRVVVLVIDAVNGVVAVVVVVILAVAVLNWVW